MKITLHYRILILSLTTLIKTTKGDIKEAHFTRTSSNHFSYMQCAFQCARMDTCTGYIVNTFGQCTLAGQADFAQLCSDNADQNACYHKNRPPCVESIQQNLLDQNNFYVTYHGNDQVGVYQPQFQIFVRNMPAASPNYQIPKASIFPNFPDDVKDAYAIKSKSTGVQYLVVIDGKCCIERSFV